MTQPFQSFPPSLLTLSPRLTRVGDPSASVQGVNTTPLADGAWCYCIENASEYQLDRASAAVPDGNLVIAPATGPGRWLKRLPVAPSPGYPVSDAIFAINDNLDPTKFLNVELAGQATGTTQTIVTTATVTRPFRLPDISGTAVVQQDTTGKVYMGIGVTGDAVNSNAGIQYSTLTANRAQLRVNQFGANSAGPGATGFKSRGLVIGQFPATPAAFVGCIGGDILYRITAIGVAANNQDIPLAGTVTIQVPPGFVSPVAPNNNYLPTEYEVALVPLAGPINGKRVVHLVTSEGETQTLRGLRAGGPATLPANLATGALWSSGVGDPNGAVTGNKGDLWSQTDGGAGTCFYVKETNGGNLGWVAK
jgi:hypothetical protein